MGRQGRKLPDKQIWGCRGSERRPYPTLSKSRGSQLGLCSNLTSPEPLGWQHPTQGFPGRQSWPSDWEGPHKYKVIHRETGSLSCRSCPTLLPVNFRSMTKVITERPPSAPVSRGTHVVSKCGDRRICTPLQYERKGQPMTSMQEADTRGKQTQNRRNGSS